MFPFPLFKGITGCDRNFRPIIIECQCRYGCWERRYDGGNLFLIDGIPKYCCKEKRKKKKSRITLRNVATSVTINTVQCILLHTHRPITSSRRKGPIQWMTHHSIDRIDHIIDPMTFKGKFRITTIL